MEMYWTEVIVIFCIDVVGCVVKGRDGKIDGDWSGWLVVVEEVDTVWKRGQGWRSLGFDLRQWIWIQELCWGNLCW